jgi:hypothetical protein
MADDIGKISSNFFDPATRFLLNLLAVSGLRVYTSSGDDCNVFLAKLGNGFQLS